MVKVHALRCHVAGEEKPDLRVGQTELLDERTLFHVGHAAMQDPNVLRLESEKRRNGARQPIERGDALGEHNNPRGFRADADLLELLDQ